MWLLLQLHLVKGIVHGVAPRLSDFPTKIIAVGGSFGDVMVKVMGLALHPHESPHGPMLGLIEQ